MTTQQGFLIFRLKNENNANLVMKKGLDVWGEIYDRLNTTEVSRATILENDQLVQTPEESVDRLKL
jgi:hypothetical protein